MTDPIPFVPHNAAPSNAPLSLLRCPNMYAIASGKGGVGKTWFSITLCHMLAKAGKRVLLFDGDLGLANVDIQLGLTPDRDIAHVTEGKMSLSDAITHYDDGNFDILAGRSGSGNLATMAVQKLTDLRTSLIEIAKDYDYVFVDLGAGVDRSVRQMAGPAAATFVVLTDEPTSLTDAYAFIKLSRAASPDADMRVIVNMATTNLEGQKTYDTIRKVCDIFLQYAPKLAGIIRRDSKVRDAIRAQTPLLIRYPNCDAANDVNLVAAQLLSD